MLSVITKELAAATGLSTYPAPYFGVSSPWVEQVEITVGTKVDDKTWRYTVKAFMATSTGPSGVDTQNVEVTKVGNEWRVSKNK